MNGASRPGGRYRTMWLFVFFDLPVTSKAERRRATRFRQSLIRDGYTMLQYSVYALHCRSEEQAVTRRNQVRAALPVHGHVRMLSVTDRQFSRMHVFVGRKPKCVESPPEQMMLF